MSSTWFEELEDLLRKVDNDTGFIAVPLIREAMIKDQHQLFHDAAWTDGCPICDEERKEVEMTIHETPTAPTLPLSTILICIRCDKEWVHPHRCDAAYGDTVVRVIKREDYETESGKS
jgi:hypothetical protein